MALLDLGESLRASIVEQERTLRSSLVLNPVENFPFAEDIAVLGTSLQGLYNSDKVRGRAEREATPLQFSGRQAIEADCRLIYSAWADALGGADATLRVLSGLHAHIVLFMAMAEPGQTVMLLPVEAGGHVSARSILERLGLQVREMVVNEEAMCVDIDRTLALCQEVRPDFLFLDRSEGLVFEDFEPLVSLPGVTSVFDASQYLTNVVCGDHTSPFDWGFDLVVASVHKNFPGPQKALLATREDNSAWQKILSRVSVYVSNMHAASTYAAGLTLTRSEWLSTYSRRMLDVAIALEDALHERDVPVVLRRRDLPPTHHLWIRERDKSAAFDTYEGLERCLIMTNFRKLPYSLGYGLRLGVNAAVRIGLAEDDVPALADLIVAIRRAGSTVALQAQARAFNQAIWSRR